MKPREVNLRMEDFPDRTLLRRFEGGSASLASRDGRFYVILSQGTLFDLLSEEDRVGVSPVKVMEFDTEAERTAYLSRRRWLPGQGLIDPD